MKHINSENYFLIIYELENGIDIQLMVCSVSTLGISH